MEYRKFGELDFKVSAVGLGTWVTGGWMWGGSEEREAAAAIERSLELGVTLIDTAPVYGFGRSEEIVGKTLKRLGARDRVVLATKCGLEWDDARRIRRNATRLRILEEIDASLQRLQTDRIDLYQVHWPDPQAPFHETIQTLRELMDQGKIRAIGVSNFSVRQMETALKFGPIHSLQPPYNLFERGIEEEVLPFCRKHRIATLTYGGLCRGLLTGKFKRGAHFPEDDVRHFDPKFSPESLPQYLSAVEKLKTLARRRGLTMGQLAIQWAARQPGVTCALVGARTAAQAEENANAFRAPLSAEDLQDIEAVLAEKILEPVGPEFMAPP